MKKLFNMHIQRDLSYAPEPLNELCRLKEQLFRIGIHSSPTCRFCDEYNIECFIIPMYVPNLWLPQSLALSIYLWLSNAK